MESLKIRDKKNLTHQTESIEAVEKSEKKVEEKVASGPIEAPDQITIQDSPEPAEAPAPITTKPTFGQALMEKVKRFFEEVE